MTINTQNEGDPGSHFSQEIAEPNPTLCIIRRDRRNAVSGSLLATEISEDHFVLSQAGQGWPLKRERK